MVLISSRMSFTSWSTQSLSSRKVASLQDAQEWASRFVAWYNHEHRHICVSPVQRHDGQDHNILARRHALYLEARAANPRRWARQTRNWQPIGAVTLNPQRESVVNAAASAGERNGFGRITQAATALTRTASCSSGCLNPNRPGARSRRGSDATVAACAAPASSPNLWGLPLQTSAAAPARSQEPPFHTVVAGSAC
jgi:hypothetical protein